MLVIKRHALYADQYLIIRVGTGPEITRIVGRARKVRSMGDTRSAYDLYLREGFGGGSVRVEHFAGGLAPLKSWLKTQHYALVDGKPKFAEDE